MERSYGRSLLLLLLLSAGCSESITPAHDGGPEAPDADRVIRLRDAGSRALDGRVQEGRPPPYPIVLVHGFFGFEDFAGVDFATYFYGVKDLLEAQGHEVFTPALDPFNNSEARGAELSDHVARILAETGQSRVNLVAHSQGGLDARYVASVHPDWVASVTTISTPHRGTRVSDVVLGIVPDGAFGALTDALVRLFGAPLWDASGRETSVIRSLEQLSSPGADSFNARYPNSADVQYFSIAGRSDGHEGLPHCDISDVPQFIARYRNYTDPVEPLLALSESVADGDGGEANDGLVPVFNARWGRFLGCIPADHFDQIGHLFGDSPGGDNGFNHLDFYQGLVAFLRAEGL